MSAIARRSNYALHQSGVLVDMKTARLPRVKPEDDGYDPRLYRKVQKPIALWLANFNLIRTCFGAGMLAIPQAISHTGIIMGPIMTIGCGVLVVHGHYTLIWCLNEISRQLRVPRTSYRHGFRIALEHGTFFAIFPLIGRVGGIIIDVFMFTSQLGICCVFVIFTTDSLRDLMDWRTSRPAQFILFVPFLILEFFLSDLKYIGSISMLGNLMNFIGMVIVIYFMLADPHAKEIRFFTRNLTNIVFGFGLMVYNLSNIAVILSLERALENPDDLTKRFGIIDVGIWVPTIAAAIFGPTAYWSCGMMEDNVLRSLPYDDDTAMAAIALYFVAIALSYPMQSKPAIDILLKYKFKFDDDNDKINNLYRKVYEIVCRILFVFLCFALCYSFPVQGPFLAFVGCLCSPQLVFVFPAIMEIILLKNVSYGKHYIYLIKDIFLIFFGMTISIVGVKLCAHLIDVRTLFIKLNM